MSGFEKYKILKVVYFDETAASNYIDIVNGGKFDWSTEENKEKLAKMMTAIESEAKVGFNILAALRLAVQGNVSVGIDSNTSDIIKSTFKNTLLTDYISMASKDSDVTKFYNDGVHAMKDSLTMYKMYSSYMNIVPKEQMPFDIEKFNDAILGERGYYEMLLNSEENPTCVLRFNINAFKNNYNLPDLNKMCLTYFGIKVGTTTISRLLINKEFDLEPQKRGITAEFLRGETDKESDETILEVYDIVLAGVINE